MYGGQTARLFMIWSYSCAEKVLSCSENYHINNTHPLPPICDSSLPTTWGPSPPPIFPCPFPFFPSHCTSHLSLQVSMFFSLYPHLSPSIVDLSISSFFRSSWFPSLRFLWLLLSFPKASGSRCTARSHCSSFPCVTGPSQFPFSFRPLTFYLHPSSLHAIHSSYPILP